MAVALLFNKAVAHVCGHNLTYRGLAHSFKTCATLLRGYRVMSWAQLALAALWDFVKKVPTYVKQTSIALLEGRMIAA